MLFANIFQDLIVQPIFNLLVFIYALLPGHNFGLAIILFTIVVRLLMWPLVKKQLHQAKAMQKLQPELKRIKAASKGDKQKEQVMIMELYKERNVSPFGSLGIIIIQFIILIGLYSGLRHVVDDPKAIISNSYEWLHSFGWMKELATDINKFDGSLFGIVDLTRAAIEPGKPFYWAAMLLVVGSAAAQYFQSVQLMPKVKDGRSLRRILKDASSGNAADQMEVNAAVSRSMRFFIPGMVLLFTINLPSALSLYWLVGGIVAYIQQGRILNQDEEEMEEIADAKDAKTDKKEVIEGEIVEKKEEKAPAPKKAKANKKRRKK
jgi:YidC/Oxa1 family membrane protein insertase